MQQVLQLSPAAALYVEATAGALRAWPNPAAVRAAFAANWEDGDWARLGRDILAEAAASLGPEAAGQALEGRLAWHAARCEEGWLAWLTVPADLAPTQATQLAERLDIAQEFGKLGLWEQDIDTGAGWWDRRTFGFFGLPAGDRAPDLAVANAMIHPDDQEPVRKAYLASARRPGVHEIHYRVMQPDGGIKRVRSTWRVEARGEGRSSRAIGIVVDETDQLATMQRHALALQQLNLAGGLVGITLWRHDIATGRVHFNTVGEAFGAYQPDPRGIPVDQVRTGVHPDDRPAVVRASDLAMRSDTAVDLRLRFRDQTGRHRDLLTRRVAQRDEKGEVIAMIGVSMDMTQQVADRARSDAVSARMELVAEGTGIGVWSFDLDTEERYWNGRMRQLFGVADEAPLPSLRRSLEQVVVPEDRHRVAQIVRLIEKAIGQARGTSTDPDTAVGSGLGAGQAMEVEFRAQRPGGPLRWLVSRTQVFRQGVQAIAHGVMIDVTDFRAAQVELKLANRRVELAAQAAGMGTWQLDIDTGHSHWDAQMYRLRGLSPDEPRSVAELIRSLPPAGDDPQVDAKVLAALEGGSGYSNEFRVCWPDGSVHWISSRGMTVANADGKVDRMFGVNWDITEQKRAEQMQREKLMAEEASRAKSEFLARMSHELRTPLNAVLGFSELLCAALPERIGDEERAHAELIRSAGRHLLALIDDVLDLARIDANRVPLADEAVSLDAILADVVRWVQTEARGSAVSVQAAASGAWVRGDAKSLRQVFVNLLSNGIKYNRAGGHVRVRVGQAAGGLVEVLVTDTGRGMAAQQLAHLFEPFNRLGAEGGQIQGTGIGLAIVHQLVQRMGGRIEVQSQLGQGAEFRLWLPRAQPTSLESTTAVPESNVAPDATPALAAGDAAPLVAIYIEDNPVNLLLVRELFERKPAWQLQTATDGAEGIARALELRPKLALIDMQLPDMDGAEVLARLRTEPSLTGLCCIALSANAMPADVLEARRLGFDDYWTKPIDFQAFLHALDRLARRFDA